MIISLVSVIAGGFFDTLKSQTRRMLLTFVKLQLRDTLISRFCGNNKILVTKMSRFRPSNRIDYRLFAGIICSNKTI